MKHLSGNISSSWYIAVYAELLILLLLISLIIGFIFVLVYRQRKLNRLKPEKIAIENYKRKIDFLTNIAHDMLNPISLIVSPAEDIVKNFNHSDSEWRNHIDMIYSNSRYIQKLINHIIDFNKYEYGKLKLNVSETNLTALLKEVSFNFVGHIKINEVKFDLQLPANEITVKIDSRKIEEVLYILLSNTLKTTDPGNKISLVLQVPEKHEDDKNDVKHVQISIFNEATSIPENKNEMILERSFKSDEEPGSAEIGLSYSRSLIEMHGGKIDIEWTKGKGGSFHIHLPIIISDSTVENIRMKKEPGYYINQSYSKNPVKAGYYYEERLKVVIAEDNDDLRNFLIQVFTRYYECYASGDGIEAYKIITEVIPEIVILDVIMPGMDGLQICKMAKENRNTCHIPVLLLTAKDADEQIIAGFNNGADAYITKPFNTNVLLAQISRLIRNRELIREKYLTQNFMVEIANTLTSKDDEFIVSLRKIMEENIADADFNVNKLAKQMNISTTQLYRKLKSLTGYSPVEFMRIMKLQKACDLLNQRKNTIKEVCYLVGFNNLSYFVKCFREFFGVTPAVYRDQGLTETAKAETNKE